MSESTELEYTLIGLRGDPSAGKSTMARILEVDYGIESVSVEAPVRSALTATDPLVATGMPLSQVVTQLGWEGAVTHRVFGGEISTLLDRMESAIRTSLGDEAWLTALEQHIARSRDEDDCPFVCVQDIGSDKEVDWIRSRGGRVWDVERPSLPGRMSRRELRFTSHSPSDAVVVNDGTRTSLRRRVSDLMSNTFGQQAAPSRSLDRAGAASPGGDDITDRLLRSVRNGPGRAPGPGPREDA